MSANDLTAEGLPSEAPSSPPSGESLSPSEILRAFIASLGAIDALKKEASALAPSIVEAAACLGEVCPEIAEFRASLKANGIDARTWVRAVRTVREERAKQEAREREVQSQSEHVEEVRSRVKTPRAHIGPTISLARGTDPESQLAASEYLVGYHAAELRFAKGLGWLAWDGKRWAQDDARAAERAKATLRLMFLQAAEDAAAAQEDIAIVVAECDLEAQRKATITRKRAEARMKAATHNQTANGIKAILALAATDRRIRVEADDLDADAHLLNVQNGTIDLRTGELLPHAPAHLITKLGRVAWGEDTDESDEAWSAFLSATTLNDDAMIAYMQKSAGYCLTGDTSQEVVFLLHGPPGSGKGTYENAIATVLGDYATTTSFDTWTHKTGSVAQRPDLAALMGSRFVSCSEASAERKLDEGVISNATGGDKISACHKYQAPITYLPRFKLVLLVNKPPRINDVAEETGIWRRLKKLPFENKVAKGEKNIDLKPYFRDPLRGAPAVLRWCVAGAIEYYKDRRLVEPKRVEEATEALRQENNPIKDFLDATCVVETDPAKKKDTWISSSKLRMLYEQWAKDEGIKFLLDAKGMGKRLREDPYRCKPGKIRGDMRVWFGLRERSSTDEAIGQADEEQEEAPAQGWTEREPVGAASEPAQVAEAPAPPSPAEAPPPVHRDESPEDAYDALVARLRAEDAAPDD